NRISRTVALLEEDALLGVKSLKRRQNDLSRSTSVHLIRRLIVPAHRKREHTVAALGLHQALALERDVPAAERHPLRVEPLRVVILARAHAVQKVVRPLRFLLERRAQT